ncbi:uncharacterized protein FA14DRAFT_162727 [Meira miltonrushii]|uniref:Small ribosomal subunit protein mS23 n=1 Tax=Meira miltonrushii TaxID=1280837 RepID=A0A316V1X8_9BASI|nr:uncharacterized protein FA14DRAFT_162727 [Meira miltonrushii]PWN31472.1 hypothetical protein FA14DRAFT_162727 [Meira miltonrushii]
MPRRIATQVGQLISRQLRGGLLKSSPVAFQTLVNHPPTPLPSRAPVQRSALDTPSSRGLSWNFEDELDGKKKKFDSRTERRKGPKLGPQPIVYLEDRVRERFYNDHPWETLNPKMLVEGETIVDRSVPDINATDLTAWGRNPGPEDVVACVVHLHRQHGLSLSQAYHNTLSTYYALRAEHEHASRIAIFEAKAYGARFAKIRDLNGNPSTTAVEIERGFHKEAEELREGAKYYAKTNNLSERLFGGAHEVDQRAASRKYRFRIRNTWAPVSQGEKYLQAALKARDGISQPSSIDAGTKADVAQIESNAEQSTSALDSIISSARASGLNARADAQPSPSYVTPTQR